MKRGTVETYKLFKLFKSLYDQRASGWLHLSDGKAQRSFYLYQGAPASLHSVAPSEQLLWFCVREGLCSSAEASAFEQQAKQTGRPLLTLFAEAGVASTERLHQVQVDLIAEVLWGALSWKSGQFAWDEGAKAPPQLTPIDPLITLTLGGVESLSDADRQGVLQQLGPRQATLTSLEPSTRAALESLIAPELIEQLSRGAQPLALAQEAHKRDPEQARELMGVLCALLLMGQLVVGAPQAQPAPPPRPAQAQPAPPQPVPRVTPNAQAQPAPPQPAPRVTPNAQAQPAPPQPAPRVTPNAQAQPAPPQPAPRVTPSAQVDRPNKANEGIESGTKDRRLIRPPENWRQFSIGRAQPTQAQPTQAQPAQAQPTQAQPAQAQPTQAQPTQAQPTQAQPTQAQPAQAQPTHAQPTQAQPAQAQPTQAQATPPRPASAQAQATPPRPAPAPAQAVTPRPAPAGATGLRSKAAGAAGAHNKAKKTPPQKILAQIEEFERLYQERDQRSYYELLGVSQGCGDEELKRAYKKLAGALHIDKFLRFELPDERLETLKKLFIELNKAHQTLSQPESRREYDLTRELKSKAGAQAGAQAGAHEPDLSAPRDLSQLLRAEQLTREAITLLKQGKAELAQAKAREAQSINSDDPLNEAVLLYTEGLTLKAGGASAVVLNGVADKLEVLTGSYEAREEPFYFLGMTRQNAGDLKRAAAAFERAVKLNPHYAEANSQLRFVQRQLSAGDTKAGATSKLGGIFGRRK